MQACKQLLKVSLHKTRPQNTEFAKKKTGGNKKVWWRRRTRLTKRTTFKTHNGIWLVQKYSSSKILRPKLYKHRLFRKFLAYCAAKSLQRGQVSLQVNNLSYFSNFQANIQRAKTRHTCIKVCRKKILLLNEVSFAAAIGEKAERISSTIFWQLQLLQNK